ncbi:MAG TPA: MFS transporter [Gammaproteobacteria bacterium]|nr:MFS transporter [Gammaproteobacteria bacterium]HET7586805.1 MFS transporter [Gammaproteobacteria bacterium]
MPTTTLSRTEGRAALSLAAIFALRMLGLFMIYPVFAVYATHLSGATAATIGLALGIYGLAQAILQIPFGTLSDRIGRKPVIAAGLILFAIGSVIAALSHSIGGVILGRALQGAGAVGSTILALGADLTREENRTKAMAMIGMTIGVSFALAVVVGPPLNRWVGVPGIFWLTAVLALCGIGVLYGLVPQPHLIRHHADTEPVPALFKRVLTNGELLRLDFGIFAQHAILTATFLALPLALKQAGGFGAHWLFYLPILAVAFVLMTPFIIIGEKYRKMKPVFIGAVAAVGLGQLSLLVWHGDLWAIGAGLLVFFAAFSLLEASLPSLISKVAPADSKGTAMGVYSSSQFLGIFVGGAVGGWLQGVFAPHGLLAVFVLTTGLAVCWLLVAMTMPAPRHLASRLIRIPKTRDRAEREQLSARLLAIAGVAEAVVVAEEGVAYLKVDNRELDEVALTSFDTAQSDAIAAQST